MSKGRKSYPLEVQRQHVREMRDYFGGDTRRYEAHTGIHYQTLQRWKQLHAGNEDSNANAIAIEERRLLAGRMETIKTSVTADDLSACQMAIIQRVMVLAEKSESIRDLALSYKLFDEVKENLQNRTLDEGSDLYQRFLMRLGADVEVQDVEPNE